MGILDRYIGQQIISGTLLALAVLLSLFSFIDFVEDVDSVGLGSYTYGAALTHSLLTMPARAFALFPPSALIGTLLGLGALAASREIIVIRAAGVSIFRITASVMKSGGVLVLFAVLVGELVSPLSEQLAQERRSVAMSEQLALKTTYGYWTRDKLSYINIRKVLPGNRLEDVYIYEFDDVRRLRTSTHALRAAPTEGGWLLEDITQSAITPEHVRTRRLERAKWNSPLLPDMVVTAVVQPESLSALGLLTYLDYLRKNGLSTARFELALLNKIVYPVATAVMIFLAVALVLGRSTPMAVGQRILIGAMVGVGFHIAHNTSVRLGLVYELSPLLTALAPTLVFSLLAVQLIRRAQ